MEKDEKETQEEQTIDANEQAKFIDILKLLKDLALVQSTLAKLTAQLTLQEGKDKIQTAVDDKKNYIQSQAKKFGVKLKESESLYTEINDSKTGILATYKESLEKINEHYKELLLEVTERKSKLEQDEQSIIISQGKNKADERTIKKEKKLQIKQLKKEIAQALKDEDTDTIEKKTKELKTIMDKPNYFTEKNKDLEKQRQSIQELIQACDEEYKKIVAERTSKINEAINSKDNQLIDLPKQNIFSKFIGSIFNKFNGIKKFRQTILQRETKNNERIAEEILPQLENDDDRQSDSQDKKPGIKDHVSKKTQQVKGRFKSIIDRAFKAKTNAVNEVLNRIAATLSEKEKQVNDARKKLKPQEQEEPEEPEQ